MEVDTYRTQNTQFLVFSLKMARKSHQNAAVSSIIYNFYVTMKKNVHLIEHVS